MASPSDIYAEQLSRLGRGYPLYRPEPDETNGPVEVGDVGYVKDGAFYRLFNALLLREDPSHREYGVPEDFEPISLGQIRTFEHDSLPGPLCGYSVIQASGSAGIPSGVLAAEATFQFNCTSNRGAILMSETDIVRQVAVRDKIFEDYLRRYCRSWYAFAETLGISVGFGELLLITECSKVTSYSSVVYSNSSSSFGVSFSIGAPFEVITAGASASLAVARAGLLVRRQSPRVIEGTVPSSSVHTVFIKAYHLGLPGMLFNSAIYWFLKKLQINRGDTNMRRAEPSHNISSRLGQDLVNMAGNLGSTSDPRDDVVGSMLQLDALDYHPAIILLALAMENDSTDPIIVHDDEWCSLTTDSEEYKAIKDYAEFYFSDRLSIESSSRPFGVQEMSRGEMAAKHNMGTVQTLSAPTRPERSYSTGGMALTTRVNLNNPSLMSDAARFEGGGRMVLHNLAAMYHMPLHYKDVISGPRHACVWHSTVFVNEMAYGTGSSSTKGLAREEAAREAVIKLQSGSVV